jgi:RND family efflux transporter MFP subunit
MAANPHTDRELETHKIEPPPPKSHLGFIIILTLVLIGLGAGVFWELSQRKSEASAVASGTLEDSSRTPTVLVTALHSAPSAATIELTGQTEPLVETSLYARTDGYIKERPVDIGARVKKGDMLVLLDTPDLDQQIAQAQATLTQSKAALAQVQATVRANAASLKLAEVTAGRTKSLVDEGVSARQDLDTAVAARDSAEANLRAAEENVRAQESLVAANDANLKRTADLKAYARLEAPYDGIITFRNPVASDPGTLITSGASTASREILRVAQIATLRVFVNVPQSYATMIQPGAREELILDEFPGRVFTAVVQSTSHEMDPATHSMLVVLEIGNQREELLPGMFAKVRIKLPHTVSILRLPGDALISRTEGPMAAVVGPDHKIHMRKLTLGRDYGSEVEVISGLNEGESVVLNSTDAVREGVLVEPKERAAK